MKHEIIMDSLKYLTLSAAFAVTLAAHSLTAQAAQEAQSAAIFPNNLSGKIYGVVRNADNDMSVSDAVVIITCNCLDGPYEVRTDTRGMYWFDAAPAGRYEVRAIVGGVSLAHLVELEVNATVRRDFSLQLGEFEGPSTDIRPQPSGGAAHCSVGARPEAGLYGQLIAFGLFCLYYVRRARRPS